MSFKVYKCLTCGKVVIYAHDACCPTMCCGKAMAELVANTADGAKEKHIPVVSVNGNNISVKVGEVAHPMTEAHLIEWIAIETEKGYQIRYLKAGEAAAADFVVAADDKYVATYAYCNLHGLYKA